MDLLFNYNKTKKTTFIIVTHDIELAAKCDIQIQLIDGKIAKTTQKKGGIK
jgi:putative ABC transport system ATP-binding protein